MIKNIELQQHWLPVLFIKEFYMQYYHIKLDNNQM